MKFVGIISDYETGLVKIGRPLKELQDERLTAVIKANALWERVLNYLNSGRLVFAFLHYVYNEQNEPIAPLSFYSDGKWVWPSYLSYYITHGYYSLLPDDFIKDITSNNFIVPLISDEEIRSAEKLYMSTYNTKAK